MALNFAYGDATCLHICEAANWIDANTKLRDRIHSISNSQNTYRTINHWETVGLLDDVRAQQGKGWRKYSFYELGYIAILTAMRDFGMPIDALHKTKASLFGAVFDKRSDITLLEIVIAFVYLKNYGNSHLLVESDGTAHFMPMEDFCHYTRHNLLPAGYVLLNINQLLNKYIAVATGQKFPVHTDIMAVLDEQEADIIYNMRRDTGVDKMTIGLINQGNKEDWTPTVDKEFSISPQNNEGLHNIIPLVENGKINLTVRGGKVVHIRANKQTKK